MTFSTFVTPTRESDTWIAGADACTSGNRETGVRSIDSRSVPSRFGAARAAAFAPSG